MTPVSVDELAARNGGAFCPACGTARGEDARFCSSCGRPFDMVVAASPSSTGVATAITKDPPPETRRRSWGERVMVVLILLVVLVGIAVLTNARITDPATGAAPAPTGLPPGGQVWFGHSFDPATFAITGRLSTVGAHEPFAMVAHLTRSEKGPRLAIRIYFDNALVSTTALTSTDEGELWGFSPGPLVAAGEWRYDFTDIGGNILASGTVTATQ